MVKQNQPHTKRATTRVDNVTFVDFKKLQQEETSQQFSNIPKHSGDKKHTKKIEEVGKRLCGAPDEDIWFDRYPEPAEADLDQPVVPLFERRESVATWLQNYVWTDTDSRRFKRAKGYAEEGRVHYLTVSEGLIAASVSGSQLEPFSVSIIFPRRSEKQLKALEKDVRNTIQQQPGSDYTFRRSSVETLFAKPTEHLRLECDCPDKTRMCKHLAATLLVFGSKIESDLQLAFQLRGLDFEQMVQKYAQQPQQEHSTAHNASLSYKNDNWEQAFWQGGQLPEIPEVPAVDFFRKADEAFLRRALKAVSTSPVEQLRAFADLEEIYHYLEQLGLAAAKAQPATSEQDHELQGQDD